MRLSDYENRYNNIRFSRADGVLEMTLHTRGGVAKWGTSEQSLHNELGAAFADLARDPENKVVLLTGTGDAFLIEMDREDRAPEGSMGDMWQRMYQEGVALLHNLMAVPVPIIAAVNGPALLHAEVPALSDIVLAAEHAEFGDTHIDLGIVPGDGVHVVWPLLLGPNRGRSFLLTCERIGAMEAKRLGFVAEVLPADKLLPRARELAAKLAKLSLPVLYHTRAILTRNIRRHMQDELGHGLALEALAMIPLVERANRAKS